MNEIQLPENIGLALLVAVVLILLNTSLAVFIAIKEKKFEWEKFPEFIATSVFPYIGGLGVLGLSVYLIDKFIGNIDLPLEYIFYTVTAIICGRYLSKIKEKIEELLLLKVKL